MRIVRLAVVLGVLVNLVLFSVACGNTSVKTANTDTTKVKPEPEKKQPALYTAKQCLTRMADSAQRWQLDAMPVHLESELNAESIGHDGKSTVWRAWFASPTTKTYRTYICSGSRLPDAAPFGVTATAESPYPANTLGQMFLSSYLLADSDKAFVVAQEHGGANLFKENPEQPVFYWLEWNPSAKELHWFVSYGKSLKETKGIGVVDASTGKYLRAANAIR